MARVLRTRVFVAQFVRAFVVGLHIRDRLHRRLRSVFIDAPCRRPFKKPPHGVLVYLLRTRRLGITYSKHGEDAERLFARADANWRSTRSTTGFCIFLANAVIAHKCRPPREP